MSRVHRPDGGTATADVLDPPAGQSDEFDVSTLDTADDLPAAESFEDQLARYELEKEKYDRWKAEGEATARQWDDRLEVGERVWVILQSHGRSEVHPATAYERHPTKGWAFNVQYPSRLTFFRDVPWCGPFWRNGCWCAVGTVQEPVPVTPVRPTPALEVRTVYHLSAAPPNGGSLDDALAAGEKLISEFTDPDRAAAHWPGTDEAGKGWIGVVTRKAFGGPAPVVERLWDSLHGLYPKPVKVEVKG